MPTLVAGQNELNVSLSRASAEVSGITLVLLRAGVPVIEILKVEGVIFSGVGEEIFQLLAPDGSPYPYQAPYLQQYGVLSQAIVSATARGVTVRWKNTGLVPGVNLWMVQYYIVFWHMSFIRPDGRYTGWGWMASEYLPGDSVFVPVGTVRQVLISGTNIVPRPTYRVETPLDALIRMEVLYPNGQSGFTQTFRVKNLFIP